MYCKKCGTEQREGQKFCPKCGTPFIEMEQSVVESSSSLSEDLPLKEEPVKEEMQKEEEIVSPVQNEQEQDQKQEPQSESFDIQPLSPSEEKKILRYAKAGMWIIIAAIVLTFVRSGFGFSFWWYLFLIIMGVIAFAFWVIVRHDPNNKGLNTGDAALVKTLSYVGVAMLLVLYLWGPLNGNYSSSRFSSSDYSSSSLDSRGNGSDEEMEILAKMSNIRGEINSILPQVEALYNAHQQHMARGFQYGSSPAWGKWQDCRNRIMSLWDEYIRLARQLDDNEDIIEEAKESKRKMDKAFDDMFGAHY